MTYYIGQDDDSRRNARPAALRLTLLTALVVLITVAYLVWSRNLAVR